jgi:epoxyqueuosine reductase QueG
MSFQAELTAATKARALELGADLVGIAPVSRWSKAPPEHSPQGLMKGARSVVVCAVQFLDASAELGAEDDPRKPGPALTEMSASGMLQNIAFRLAKWLQDRGRRAIEIRQSGAWAYRPRPGADRGWIADMSLYYAAVCAGMGEIGWNNLCITPQFGTRQRFVAVVTDADLVPDPMYSGPALCDKCKLCAKHCPTRCFDKEVSGMLSVEIEGRKFEFPNRNLWRCAIGENFMLDVFLDWPEKVDEAVITRMEELACRQNHQWVTGWKMGMCIKHCVPPHRRYFEKSYCKAPRRRRDVAPDLSPAATSAMLRDLDGMCDELGVDLLAAVPAGEFAARGLDLTKHMPDAKGAIVLGLGYPENCALNSDFWAVRADLSLARVIQERYGHSAMTRSAAPADVAAVIAGLAQEPDQAARQAQGQSDAPRMSWGMAAERCDAQTRRFGRRQLWRVVLTSAPVEHAVVRPDAPAPAPQACTAVQLREELRRSAAEQGGEMFAVAPADRLDGAMESLASTFARYENYFEVRDHGWGISGDNIWAGQAMPFNPKAKPVKLAPRRPRELLPEARSVIVVGMRLLEASVDDVGMAPGNKAGHYHNSTHEEAFSQLSSILRQVCRRLDAQGYRAMPAFDLENLASQVSGGWLDLTACRFWAAASGLADIGWNGIPLTPRFGPRQRFACIITDAPLPYDAPYSGPKLCTRCMGCTVACGVGAISRDQADSVVIGSRKFEWGRLDRLRCDCAHRYGLVASEGPCYIGCRNDYALPDRITPEWVCGAIESADRVQRPSYTPTVESCYTVCKSLRTG